MTIPGGTPQDSTERNAKDAALDALALAGFTERVTSAYGLFLRGAIDAERFADCFGQEIEGLNLVFPASATSRDS